MASQIDVSQELQNEDGSLLLFSIPIEAPYAWHSNPCSLAESAAQGQAVLETEPDSTAARQIFQLVKEIEEFMRRRK